jgi:hypothetical protein
VHFRGVMLVEKRCIDMDVVDRCIETLHAMVPFNEVNGWFRHGTGENSPVPFKARLPMPDPGGSTMQCIAGDRKAFSSWPRGLGKSLETALNRAVLHSFSVT